jgi:hypothetical protein
MIAAAADVIISDICCCSRCHCFNRPKAPDIALLLLQCMIAAVCEKNTVVQCNTGLLLPTVLLAVSAKYFNVTYLNKLLLLLTLV